MALVKWCERCREDGFSVKLKAADGCLCNSCRDAGRSLVFNPWTESDSRKSNQWHKNNTIRTPTGGYLDFDQLLKTKKKKRTMFLLVSEAKRLMNHWNGFNETFRKQLLDIPRINFY